MTRRRHAGAALLTLLLTFSLAGCSSPDDHVEVEIEAGTLRGVVDNGMRSWLGVPYAAPPVDDLRWTAPRPAESWSGTREASDFGSSCLQMEGAAIKSGTDEDCLFLNVFRPDDDQDDLPVMVWFHGGGLNTGSGDLPLEMASSLVKQGVVLVSLNYRLGRLGYFAHPALAVESADEGGGTEPTANFGLLDQVAALKWVHDNIGGFGGDAEQVTIFGISAGGASVNYLMTSPLATGLFDKAISGSGLGGEQPPPYATGASQGETFAASLGAHDANAQTLRELDGGAIVARPPSMLLNELPILDSALPSTVSQAFADGSEADVPFIIGATDRELVDLNYQAFGVDPVVLRQQLAAGREAELHAAYGDTTAFDQHFLADVLFTEPARRLASEHARRERTFLYRFSVVGPQVLQLFGGAVHGSEYPYVFGYGDGDPSMPDSDELADEVSECWVSFATSGLPRCGGVTWPEVHNGELMEFTNEGPITLDSDPWKTRLDLVAQIYAGQA